MELEQKVLPFLFVLTGTLNVLLIKWSDGMEGECSDGKWRPFQHPVVQTALMFLGEFLCFVVYKVVNFFVLRRGDGSENLVTRGGRDFSPISLLLPAALDSIASVLLFTGLYLTYASSFQMLRGAAIIFVGIFSSMYLNQALISRHWAAMITIGCGITILISVDIHRVYYDQASITGGDANSILTGDLLIVCAQIIHAAQFVYEEKHLKGADDIPAMQAAGWQGVFGLLISALLGLCMTFMPAQMPFGESSRAVFDDLADAVSQLRSNPLLLLPLGGFVVSCACYNFVALSIVKYSSTANRILADGVRVVFIWLVAMLLEWEYFTFATLLAFMILQMGAIAYRNAIFLEFYRSLVVRISRRRYADLNVDSASDPASIVTTSSPADVI